MSGRHRKKRSWALAWILGIMLAPWGGIWAYAATSSTPAAHQAPIVYQLPPAKPVPSVQPRGDTAAIVEAAPGDTLWSLAHQHCGDGAKWGNLAKASGIKYPYILTMKEKIRIDCNP